MRTTQISEPNPGVLSAWQEQVAQATRHPSLQQQLVYGQGELLPRFAEHYERLTSLSRPVRRSLQRRWKQSLAGVALLLALGTQPALAATINVGGGCRLIDAITAANTNTAVGACARGRGADTIVLPRGSTRTLISVNNTTYGPTGLPLIRSVITIMGNGSTIRRAANAPKFRILGVAETGNLRLVNTTVSGGRTLGEGAVDSAKRGGGVYVVGGVLTLTNTTISGNSAFGGLGGSAGGIESRRGPVNIINSTVSGNSGGGVSSGYQGDFTITNSIISGNSDDGVSGYYSQIEVIDSTVSNNSGDGVIDGSPEGGLGRITVTRSTISGNSGDGLNGDSSSMDVTNSTISGNARGVAGGDDEGLGLTLTNTTITGNSGGGILISYSYNNSLVLSQSLISGNGETEISVPTKYISVTVDDFNVFGRSGNAGVTGFTPGPTDIVPTQPLGAILNTTLANNGGPTRTHALVAGSSAIDTVIGGTCPPPPRDQRGVSRPQDGNGDGGVACDSGAFELRPASQ